MSKFPIPSCPALFQPNPYTNPDDDNTRVWNDPVVMETAGTVERSPSMRVLCGDDMIFQIKMKGRVGTYGVTLDPKYGPMPSAQEPQE